VLAVACDHRVVAAGDAWRADALLARVPARAWQLVSAGRGANGHRLYDWAIVRLDDGDPDPGGQAGRRWLLVRRNRTTGELAFYHCWTPRPVALAMLAHAVLVVLAATHRTRHPPSPGLISLTCNEVQHLLATLLARPAEDLSHRLAWSVWRRRHQARARTCHYQRQANRP